MAVVTKEQAKTAKNDKAATSKKDRKPRTPKDWTLNALRTQANRIASNMKNGLDKDGNVTDDALLAEAQKLALDLYCGIRANRRGYDKAEGDFDVSTGRHIRKAVETAAETAEAEATPDPEPKPEPKSSGKGKGKGKKAA